jgi:hypothetical protein
MTGLMWLGIHIANLNSGSAAASIEFDTVLSTILDQYCVKSRLVYVILPYNFGTGCLDTLSTPTESQRASATPGLAIRLDG